MILNYLRGQLDALYLWFMLGAMFITSNVGTIQISVRFIPQIFYNIDCTGTLLHACKDYLYIIPISLMLIAWISTACRAVWPISDMCSWIMNPLIMVLLSSPKQCCTRRNEFTLRIQWKSCTPKVVWSFRTCSDGFFQPYLGRCSKPKLKLCFPSGDEINETTT